MIHVAVGIIFDTNKNILVAKRDMQKFQGGRWEFPGGKVENNETVFQALQRELKEEIGIDVIDAAPWWQVQHSYSEKNIFLDIWTVTHYTGTPHGKEGQAVRWVSLTELSKLDIPDANQIIMQKLFSG